MSAFAALSNLSGKETRRYISGNGKFRAEIIDIQRFLSQSQDECVAVQLLMKEHAAGSEGLPPIGAPFSAFFKLEMKAGQFTRSGQSAADRLAQLFRVLTGIPADQPMPVETMNALCVPKDSPTTSPARGGILDGVATTKLTKSNKVPFTVVEWLDSYTPEEAPEFR